MKKKSNYIHPLENYLLRLKIIIISSLTMTTYLEYHANLSDGQKTNLAKAIKTGSELTLRLKNNQLRGNDELMLTKTQVNKIQKAITSKTGADINAKRLKMRYKYNSGYPIQDINSVRCGYYSLFFLDNAYP